MDKLVIQGGKVLKGEVVVSGSKNASLPIMAATLLTDEPCVLRNVPRLRDTMTMVRLLESLGKEVHWKAGRMEITMREKSSCVASYDLVSTMRGSFCVLGPLLTRYGYAKVSLPGGCVIGIRPVDLHLKGIEALGAKLSIENGYIIAQAKRLRGDHIYLGGVFGSSVLATANVMMAAVLAQGDTIIDSAACEPEIEDLANLLIKMGAKITGHGGPRIVVKGVRKLRGTDFKISPDRIEAGTYIIAAAATNSQIHVKGARAEHLMALIDKLKEVGVQFQIGKGGIHVQPTRQLRPVSVTTYPYPGFPTDLQAQFMALMAMTEGVSIITDKVYPDRFIHIAELNRMGANIRREGTNAIVQGVKGLHGAPVMASDLRASAALVVAGLAAEGTTEIHRIYHLDRGYEKLDQKFNAIGARIERQKE